MVKMSEALNQHLWPRKDQLNIIISTLRNILLLYHYNVDTADESPVCQSSTDPQPSFSWLLINICTSMLQSHLPDSDNAAIFDSPGLRPDGPWRADMR